MKYIARIVIFSALLGLSAKAAPFMAVGDNAELFVTAAAAVQFDSNIYLNATNEKKDTIFSFTPGVDLVFGKGSATTGDVYYREEIRRYNSNDVQNANLADVGFKSDYSNGVTKANFNASYTELAQNDNQIQLSGDIVHRNISNVGAKVEFGISEKTSLGIGATYIKTNYGPVSFVDSGVWSLPIDVYYQASPKLDWSFGYSYRSTDLNGAARSSKDQFLNLGARGEFTPKLTGQVHVGYGRRAFDVGSDKTLFSLDGNFTYQYSDKTNYQLTMSNDFGISGFGDSTKVFSLGLNANNQFSEQWYVSAGVNYMAIAYPTRTDDFVQGQVSVTYVYNTYLNFGASLTLRNNSSALALAQFSENVFSIGANIRY